VLLRVTRSPASAQRHKERSGRLHGFLADSGARRRGLPIAAGVPQDDPLQRPKGFCFEGELLSRTQAPCVQRTGGLTAYMSCRVSRSGRNAPLLIADRRSRQRLAQRPSMCGLLSLRLIAAHAPFAGGLIRVFEGRTGCGPLPMI